MFNRRNAFFGWLAWRIGKRVLKRKAKTAVPSIDTETKKPNRPAIVSAIATMGIVAWLLKRRQETDEDGNGDVG